MAITKEEFLKKFVKGTKLSIESAVPDNTVDRDGNEVEIFRVTMKDKMKITGRNILPTGAALICESNTFSVAAENIETFLKGFDLASGVYEGPLQLDVAKPKGRMVNGQYELNRPAALWLVSVTFDKASRNMRNNANKSMMDKLKELYGTGENPNGGNAAAIASAAKDVEATAPKQMATGANVGA